jgi:catechol 2,3-dioxygenase-like lactoylglutathione lyase family enzyme
MPILGLRHLALRVADPQASKRFYCDSFGMAGGVGAGPRQRLPVVGVRQPGPAPRRAGGAGALDHLGFIVDSKEEVDRLAQQLGERGVAVAAAPRDHRDGSRSFYCLDPDGLRIQVLYEPTLSQQKIR